MEIDGEQLTASHYLTPVRKTKSGTYFVNWRFIESLILNVKVEIILYLGESPYKYQKLETLTQERLPEPLTDERSLLKSPIVGRNLLSSKSDCFRYVAYKKISAKDSWRKPLQLNPNSKPSFSPTELR